MLGRESAQELVQDVFLKLWRQPESYRRERGRFGSWFLSVVHHRAIDELRRRRRQAESERSAGEEVERWLKQTPDPKPSVETQAARDSRRAALIEALRTLPAQQREVLWLAYFDGLTQAEMSQRLKIPLGTVKTRVRLGLEKLKESLESRGITRWEG
jgi:RNA polymerase sigma-70 factor (ECF subfamily)